MTAPIDAILKDWSPPWFLTATIFLAAVIYTRGYFAVRKTRPALFPEWRLYSFLLGMLMLWLSIGSPMDGFADALLSAHMVEHLILMSIVPPLVLLGYPVVPMIRGLPRPFVRVVLGPLFRSRRLSALGRLITSPMIAWLAMNLAYAIWHLPAAYDYALDHERVHDLEHICFLGTAMLFWWPIVQPWPTKRRDYGWGMLPYLLTADFVNTGICAYLAFCDRPVYLYYQQQPNLFHVDLLADQVLGAGFMWVIGSMIFLFPAVAITFRMLQGSTHRHSVAAR